MTYREWIFECEPCNRRLGAWLWNYEVADYRCPACNEPVELYVPQRSKSPGIATDDIPGGIEIRHLSNKPEKFYSKTEIKRACNERGFSWADDTPKKYNVHWSGRERANTTE